MSTSVAEFRGMLIEAIGAVRRKALAPDDAKAMAMLAQQVNASLQVEVNVRREEKLVGNGEVATIGQLVIGETKLIEAPLKVNVHEKR